MQQLQRKPWRAMAPKPWHTIGLALVLTISAGTAHARSFLWRVAKKGHPTSYLLGSIHLGKKSFYPLATAITSAFAKSQVLVFEARPDEMAKAAQLIMQKGMFTPPDSLRKHVSAKTFQLAQKKANELGLPSPVVERMRPWLLGVTFSAQSLQQAGYDPNLGIEMVLIKRKGNRAVKVLEGAAFQINLLSSFSPKEQEYFLRYSIEQAKLATQFMTQMVTAWKRGETRRLSKLLTAATRKTPELKDVYRRLITGRNVTMSQTIDAMLTKDKRSHFFVIGSGHLVGPKSIPSLLKKQGYRLQQQ